MISIICLAAVSLTGCTNLERATLIVECENLRGRVGEKCIIDVPSVAAVEITGESIHIKY